ncbi:tyrosine-protein phosphatase [Chitinophaga cymbidii]|uniref:tyrosine-protein phosphatase n=1 Tax=Chitinophaga cymbidii TaxID=1096750 RepID=UPI0011BE2373|nr:CpsB/CapC family capsule biosynthesis tyrosine phosphatase [Chitinophaga cymbidii]
MKAIGTDIHSHLVPGVDDGSPDIHTSLSFIEQLQELGIRKIVTTPHIMTELYPNSIQTLSAPFGQLKDAPLPVHLAAEYYMDENFSGLMEAPLLTLNGELVLVEISFISEPFQLHSWLFDIQTKGYRPVLAHPERYSYFHDRPEAYRDIRNRGVDLQVNLLSLTGYYGRQIQQAAWWLIDQQLVDFIGTDLHHQRHLRGIKAIGEDKKLVRLLQEYPFRNNSI